MTGISSGSEHVTALTTNGRIYQWGKLYYQYQWNLLVPGFVSGIKKVTQVACGQLHTVALTEDGHVYSWGCNAYGPLGTPTATCQADPVKISGSNGFDVKIISVACGGWTSFALDCGGNVSKFISTILAHWLLFARSQPMSTHNLLCNFRYGLGVTIKLVHLDMLHPSISYFHEESHRWKAYKRYCSYISYCPTTIFSKSSIKIKFSLESR